MSEFYHVWEGRRVKLRFFCPVTVRVRPKSLSSYRRILCPVVVHVRLKSLSSSGLSSAELAPSAIPSKRATPQSGTPNSSSVPNAQWPT